MTFTGYPAPKKWLILIPTALTSRLLSSAESHTLNVTSLEMQLRNRFGAARKQTQCNELDLARNNLDFLLRSNLNSERKWSQTDTVLAYKKNGLSSLAEHLTLNDEGFDDEWVNIMCPDVVDYFSRVDYFDYTAYPGRFPSVLTTRATKTFVCLLRLFDTTCRRIGARWFLHAGSHLGAVLHGGPIPWDDDTDVMVDKRYFTQLASELTKISIPGHERFSIRVVGKNALKVFMSGYPLTSKKHPPDLGWPFLDVFGFSEKEDGLVREYSDTGLNGGKADKPRPTLTFTGMFPLRNYFFGGIVVPGPPRDVAAKRYNLSTCVSPLGNHRYSGHRQRGITDYTMSCCRLSRHFPFMHYLASDGSDGIDLEVLAVNGSPIHVTRVLESTGEVLDMSYVSVLEGGAIRVTPMRTYIDSKSLLSLQLPSHAFSMEKSSSFWNISSTHRMQYLSQVGEVDGKVLTREILNLNEVEVDNTISKFSQENTTSLKVVEFNAERGSQWFLAAQQLRALPGLCDADIILLNEMDIGMARSRNEHTTRLMAHSLGMNYAWGLEFVELTNGNAEEQNKTAGQTNLYGLHGNAILSKYPIADPIVLRDALHRDYFTSSASGTNANGYEKRLGGRMALLVTLKSLSNIMNVRAGSIHKITDTKNIALLRKFAKSGPTVFAGDQQSKYCAQFGLQESGNSAHKTTRATCDPVGKFLGHHGDIICSNIGYSQARETYLPCISVFGEHAKLSDHGFTSVQLGKGTNRMVPKASTIQFRHNTSTEKSYMKTGPRARRNISPNLSKDESTNTGKNVPKHSVDRSESLLASKDGISPIPIQLKGEFVNRRRAKRNLPHRTNMAKFERGFGTGV